jgi:hypothetical protein
MLIFDIIPVNLLYVNKSKYKGVTMLFSITNFNTLYLFKFKAFSLSLSLLAAFFLSFLPGCSVEGSLSNDNFSNATNAQIPTITVQPTNASYTRGNTAKHLSVTAIVNDGEVLNCQWYKNSYSMGNVGGNNFSGGITGSIYHADITHICLNGSINGKNYVSGIVGNIYEGSITWSYPNGNVVDNFLIGGIAGSISNTVITNSAAINPVVAGNWNANRIVGFIDADNDISNSFMLSFMTITPDEDDDAGTDKTQTELKMQTTYANAMISDGLVWKFGNDKADPLKIDSDKNNGYPYFY